MNYCAKCEQRLPKPWFRIVNGPAVFLLIWPALDLLGGAVIYRPPGPPPQPRGGALAVGAVLTVAVYAWIALSGRWRSAHLPRSCGETTMGYCSKCGQRLPKPWFRVVNGPAALLLVWPALGFLGYGVIPAPQAFSTYPYGTGLVAAAALTVAVYAWIARSGR